MSKSLPMPVAAAIAVVVLGVIGFFLYNHFLASPPALNDSSPHAAGKGGLRKPATQAEMQALGQSMMQGKGAH